METEEIAEDCAISLLCFIAQNEMIGSKAINLCMGWMCVLSLFHWRVNYSFFFFFHFSCDISLNWNVFIKLLHILCGSAYSMHELKIQEPYVLYDVGVLSVIIGVLCVSAHSYLLFSGALPASYLISLSLPLSLSGSIISSALSLWNRISFVCILVCVFHNFNGAVVHSRIHWKIISSFVYRGSHRTIITRRKTILSLSLSLQMSLSAHHNPTRPSTNSKTVYCFRGVVGVSWFLF